MDNETMKSDKESTKAEDEPEKSIDVSEKQIDRTELLDKASEEEIPKKKVKSKKVNEVDNDGEPTNNYIFIGLAALGAYLLFNKK